MKVSRSPAEREQIKKLIQDNPTFYKVFRENWTKIVMDDLKNKLYGKIPRNFLVNITGEVGTPTGIFKSSMGLQIAFTLDPSFTLHSRVAFSINDLLDKIQNNTEFDLCNRCYFNFEKNTTSTYELGVVRQGVQCENCENQADKTVLLKKLIFFLDEQTKTLKMGGLIRLQNIIDTVRQRQICFITCGVEGYGMHFTTYQLQRIQESSDSYLPTKRVRYGVFDEERDIYYGYFSWDIWKLSNPFWKQIWDEYSVLKQNFQRVSISQQISSMDFESYAETIMQSDDFLKCFKRLKDGREVLQASLVKSLIYKQYPDITNNERGFILSEIQMMINDNTFPPTKVGGI